VKQIIRLYDRSVSSIFYEIGGKWLMIHDVFKFTIYDLSSNELKTIIQSKIDTMGYWFDAYG
jgi:hypothetical protein